MKQKHTLSRNIQFVQGQNKCDTPTVMNSIEVKPFLWRNVTYTFGLAAAHLRRSPAQTVNLIL